MAGVPWPTGEQGTGSRECGRLRACTKAVGGAESVDHSGLPAPGSAVFAPRGVAPPSFPSTSSAPNGCSAAFPSTSSAPNGCSAAFPSTSSAPNRCSAAFPSTSSAPNGCSTAFPSTSSAPNRCSAAFPSTSSAPNGCSTAFPGQWGPHKADAPASAPPGTSRSCCSTELQNAAESTTGKHQGQRVEDGAFGVLWRPSASGSSLASCAENQHSGRGGDLVVRHRVCVRRGAASEGGSRQVLDYARPTPLGSTGVPKNGCSTPFPTSSSTENGCPTSFPTSSSTEKRMLDTLPHVLEHRKTNADDLPHVLEYRKTDARRPSPRPRVPKNGC